MRNKFTIMLFFIMVIMLFPLEIMVPKAPPAIPLIKLQEEGVVKINYYTNAKTEVLPDIIKGKDKLFIIPVNLGAKLYNSGKDIELLGVVSEGLLSIVSSDESVKSITDLNDKKLYIGARGSSPDVIARYVLGKNSVNANIEYRTSPEIAKLIIAGKIENAVLPEPLATLVMFKKKEIRRVLELKEKFNNEMPQVGIFCSKSFLKVIKKKL